MTAVKKVSVKVPGSSANLGAGFDTLALAYQLYCRMDFELDPDFTGGPEIKLTGERVSLLPQNDENLVVQILLAHFPNAKDWLKHLKVSIDSEIPLGRGLGSSAAAIVGTLWAGFYFSGVEPDRKVVFDLAAKIEGHPDNVAASTFGGLVATARDGDQGRFIASSVHWPENWSCVVVVPDYEVKTSDARAVLPKNVSMADAVSNIQNTALFLLAVQKRDSELLQKSLRDSLHEPYRKSLVPEIELVRQALKEAPVNGVVLSGAGSSILVFADKRNERFVVDALKSWSQASNRAIEVINLKVDEEGVRVSYDCDGEERSIL